MAAPARGVRRWAGPEALRDVIRENAERDPARAAFTYLADGERVTARLTRGDLDRLARQAAVRIREHAHPGDRVLLAFPNSFSFVVAFVGCLYADAVAVPVYPPRPGDRHGERLLLSIAADCRPSLALTEARWADQLRAAVAAPVLATDGGDADADPQWAPGPGSGDALAFLQYTSGSTGQPKGVMVTNANLLHAERMIAAAFEHDERSTMVGWLPLYHDMGLVGNVLQPLFNGAEAVLMPPEAFLQRPVRWLRAITRHRAVTSGAPNFAYELCARRTKPEELDGLDLSSWEVAYNGAEPVRAATLERFARAFAPVGFDARAFYPCYGLAETTLFASGPVRGRPRRPEPVDPAALEQGRAVADPHGTPLVACGHGWLDRVISIVDPVTRRPCADRVVGEIWLAGGDVTRGYWGREEETAAVFRARLEGDGGQEFLRTGDLGYWTGSELVVTGRLKDLIIVAGRNLYPQEIEASVEDSHPAIRRGCSAAFAYDEGPEQRLGVVAELRVGVTVAPPLIAELIQGIRSRVSVDHRVWLDDVALLAPGGVAKTSSGKVRRGVCRRGLLTGTLPIVSASLRSGDRPVPEREPA